MKRIFAATAALVLISALEANAQKFNPKVEVTNAYEGKVVEAQKKDISMSIPDSLLRFQYKVDYSVFDNPYNGSYEFKPYSIEMRPDASPSTAKKLFVSLGAGYQMHPEADVVFTPAFKKLPATLSFYDTFRGFWGNYGYLGTNGTSVDKITWKDDGYVLNNRVGAAARYQWSNMALDADINYHLLAAQDTIAVHTYMGAEGLLRLSPIDPAQAEYFYGAKLYVKAGRDDLTYPAFEMYNSNRHKTGVNDMGFDASFGSIRGLGNGVLVDMGMQAVICTGLLEAVSTRLWVAPHYAFNWDRGYASLGLKVSYLTGLDRSHSEDENPVYSHRSQIFYPDVKAKFYIVPEKFAVYARATGGDYIDVYPELLEQNPFLSTYNVLNGIDSSSEQVNAVLGFEGNFGEKFHYDISGGYVDYLNGRLDAMTIITSKEAILDDLYNPDVYLAGTYVYRNYQMAHADFSFLWKSARVDVDGHFGYKYTNLSKKNPVGVYPPAFEGDLRFTYNWQRRVFAGLSVKGVSKRDGIFTDNRYLSIPGYVDLGLHASYKINQKWTVWAKGGNLLNQRVQTYFLHPEAGPYFTLGASFNI